MIMLTILQHIQRISRQKQQLFSELMLGDSDYRFRFPMIRQCGASRSLNPAPPRYFFLAVGRFEVTREPILTAFDPDFCGQKWTVRKSSGGKTGGLPLEI